MIHRPCLNNVGAGLRTRPRLDSQGDLNEWILRRIQYGRASRNRCYRRSCARQLFPSPSGRGQGEGPFSLFTPFTLFSPVSIRREGTPFPAVTR